MHPQPRLHPIAVDDADQEKLHSFLMSDRVPPDSLTPSELDGFLTAIVAGPEPIMPGEWLPEVFDGQEPVFADANEASAILGAITGRYNEIFRLIADDDLDPVFESDRDAGLIAEDWAQGFLHGIMLRADAWEPLFSSRRHGTLLFPILALCSDENGEPLIPLPQDGEESVTDEQLAELIPNCVLEIAAYWRLKQRGQFSMTGLPPEFSPAQGKVGRNEPCPCGSGKKFKKCCGKAA